MDAMNAIRRAGDLPGIRAVALRPPVRKILARILMVRFLQAAWDTTTPGSLIRREIFNRGEVGHYQLKGTDQVVWLKHGRDLEALYELIHEGEYEVPAPLRARLDKPNVRIVDVGANIGMFSAWALTHWPDASITSFEPEPDNAALCREWSAAQPNVTLIEAAATNDDGELRFETGVGSGSYVTDSEDAIAVPAVDIFPHLAEADLVKIDIEGGEWSILTDKRMAELTNLVLVMEYHRHMAPFWPPHDAAVEYLEKAGFATGFNKPNYWGHGILWAWKD